MMAKLVVNAFQAPPRPPTQVRPNLVVPAKRPSLSLCEPPSDTAE